MLATNASSVLRNSLLNESAVQMQSKLQGLLEAIMDILKAPTLYELVTTATTCIQRLLSSPQALLYLYRKGNLISVQTDCNDEFEAVGLAGQCVSTGNMLNIGNAYDDPAFNNQVDIETLMPVIILPVKDADLQVLAVLELVNPRGI